MIYRQSDSCPTYAPYGIPHLNTPVRGQRA